METKEKQSKVIEDLGEIRHYMGWVVLILAAHTIYRILAWFGGIYVEIVGRM